MRKQLVKCFKEACNALTDARLEALEKERVTHWMPLTEPPKGE